MARVRDLINTPASDMMPKDLAAAVADLAAGHGAELRVVTGEALLDQGYPAIHAVGRASVHRPRLIDLTWGDSRAPRLTLVGKGVCFDSGGLDIKPASGMRLMKKDMGGAAHAIGLADLVMSTALPVRLRMLVPAVENAIAGNAYRPGDVIPTRKGLTIEVENTDAEGRIVLSDALAGRRRGCARSDDRLRDPHRRGTRGAGHQPACDVLQRRDGGRRHRGRRTRRPRRGLANAAARAVPRAHRERGRGHHERTSQPYGGAITAALFLQAFVPDEIPWAHFDIMAWTTRAKPARPVGGEAMALRAVFEFLERRYRA